MRIGFLVALQDVSDSVIQTTPSIVREAAQSPMGLLALAFLISGGLGYAFFKGAGERTRIAMFVLIFAGVLTFGVAVVSSGSFMGSARQPAPPASAQSQPTPAASVPFNQRPPHRRLNRKPKARTALPSPVSAVTSQSVLALRLKNIPRKPVLNDSRFLSRIIRRVDDSSQG